MSRFQLSPQEEQKLRELLHVFLEENAKLNLSAYRTEEQCWVGNVLDSIAARHVLERLAVGARHAVPLRIIDVGTGGGFPLLPLAILFPEISFTGLDATKKKVDAVRRMTEKLNLKNVQLLAGRAEEFGHDPRYREQYDVVLGRAIAALPTLLEFMSPFATVGGMMLCWKSIAVEEELQAALNARLSLKCRLSERFPYDLDALAAHVPLLPPGETSNWGSRQLLLFEKTAQLPQMFPRRVGLPKKEPL